MRLLRFARILACGFAALNAGSCHILTSEEKIILSELYPNVPPSQPIIINRKIGDDMLTMRGDPQFAGAISSLMFRGQEYINSADHGRLMQGAIAYNGRFECLNPTQAGGSRDRENLGQRSTSKRLRSFVAPDGNFEISTRMAYWLRPGMTCNIPGQGRSRVDNTARLSKDIYAIGYRFGLNGHQNVASLDITYDIDGTYRSAVVEAITIYTPPAFNTFHKIDPATATLSATPVDRPEEDSMPTIVSTADGAHAIAFLSLQDGATYARFRFPDTQKISLVYRPNAGITGHNSYRAALIIGTRDEVARDLIKLIEETRG